MKDVLGIIYITGAIQGFFLAVSLFVKKANRSANKYLATAVLFWSFMLLENYFEVKNLYAVFPHIIYSSITVKLIFWPLIFLYVSTLTSLKKIFDIRRYLHFLPFILALFYMYPFYIRSGIYKLDYLDIYGVSVTETTFELITSLYGFIYMIMLFLILKKYSKKIENFFSDIEKTNLVWLKILIIVVFAIWIADLTLSISYFSDFKFPLFIETIIRFLSAAWIYVAAYFSLSQPDIFKETHEVVEITATKEIVPDKNSSKKKHERNQNIKYKRSGLDDEMAESGYRELKLYMAKEKPYLNSDITIKMISEEIGMKVNHLSQIINSMENLNFYEFINRYRIDEVKRQLKLYSPESKSILEISYDCGFKSKSTFNSIFKKETGMTPSQYKSSSEFP